MRATTIRRLPGFRSRAAVRSSPRVRARVPSLAAGMRQVGWALAPSRPHVRARVPLLSAVAALLAGCATSPSPFFPAGRGAGMQATLGIVTTVIVCVVSLIVYVIMAIALWRRRAPTPADPLAPPPPGVPDNRRAFRWILGGTLATSVILVAFAIASLATVAASAMPAHVAPVSVRLTGHQWWWQVQYLGSGGEIEAESANEIHIPVGVPVRFELIGGDVIHSFWVPELQGKTDMIPGHPNTAWLEADHPGVYRGQCGDYCGLQHAHMDFLVVAEPRARFDAYLAREEQGQAARDSAQGARVFVGSSCGLCHTIRGTDALGKVGPDLTHFGSRRTIGAALMPNDVGRLTAWIVNAQHFKPGIVMPTIGAPKGGSLTALSSYLESLK